LMAQRMAGRVLTQRGLTLAGLLGHYRPVCAERTTRGPGDAGRRGRGISDEGISLERPPFGDSHSHGAREASRVRHIPVSASGGTASVM